LSKRKRLSESNLDPEQQQAIDRLYEHDETLLIAGVGFGKAIVGLTALQQLIRDGHLRRVLVLAPLKVATLTWGTEPAVWDHIDPGLVGVACGNPRQRNAAVESGAPVVVTNFENIGWMLKTHGHLFDGLLIDEISKLKTVGGTGARTLRHWVKRLKWRAGMSANPIAECGQDIYGQALLLDLGKALGTRKAAFTERYFYPEDYHRRVWAMMPDADIAIGLELQHLLYFADHTRYKAGLPELRQTPHYLDLPADGRALYEMLDATGLLRQPNGYDGVVVAKSAGTRAMKLFQIAAGGLYAGADDERELVWSSPFKVDYAAALVAKLPANRSAVIVYQYTFELDQLRALYPTAPVLGGGGRFTPQDLENWSRGNHRVLLMHPNSAAHGLNLQFGSNILIQLSPVWGADPGQQIPGRLCRRGQPQPTVEQHILVARGTRDEKAVAAMERKNHNERTTMAAMKNNQMY
jgi:hypothetical protein